MIRNIPSKKQRGAGLIEVLVAAIIMAVGILGYAGMQVRSLAETTNAQYRMQALALAGDLVARVRSNASQLQIYLNADYGATPSVVDCSTNQCSPAQIAAADIASLQQHVAELLPGAEMSLAQCPERDTYCARVAWNGREASATQCDAPVLDAANKYESHCVNLEVFLW